MKPKVLELQPNRNLLDPDFNGYKLSLDTLPLISKELSSSICRAFPDASQYSVLHAKLFGLHNHLVGETVEGITYVYFIDTTWNVRKCHVDSVTHTLVETVVWQMSEPPYKQNGDYNVSLKLFSENLAVLSDGAGFLYILNTGLRKNNDYWSVLYRDEILGDHEKFVIQDVLYDPSTKTLNLLLLSISQEKPTDCFLNIVKWITIKEGDDKKWNLIALRELKGKGDMNYCFFEPEGKALYLASEKGFKFTIDSENPVETTQTEPSKEKKYHWSQNTDNIEIKFKLPEGVEEKDITIDTKQTEISVKIKDDVLLSGSLYQAINEDSTTWCISATRDTLQINLNKTEHGLMWPELVEGDDNGEFILTDASVSEEAHQQLEHLCNDSEVSPQNGQTFNSQQVEDCDFADDKTGVFERICCKTHQITHRVHLGTHPILMTVRLSENLPPSLGLRHDVDVCLWQPTGTDDENWTLAHQGTLLAFGYVQASKQQRKFLSCTPDLRYSFICESSRHVFVYCQNKSLTSSELRNRTTGKKVGSIAEQRVISIENDEILGMYVSNTDLFLLTENKLLHFTL